MNNDKIMSIIIIICIGMQELKVEHEKVTSITAKKCRREAKGRVLAISRRIYRLMQTEDVFYVESESTDNVYYYGKFKPEVIEWCSCLDNSTRGLKCKHLWSIEFAIRMGTLKDTDKLPADAKKAHNIVAAEEQETAIAEAESYRNDDYSF